jgi:hypothetical protein
LEFEKTRTAKALGSQTPLPKRALGGTARCSRRFLNQQEIQMRLWTEDRNVDPARRHYGPKPTDPNLPIRERTHPGAFLATLVVVLVLCITLLAFGVAHFTQSTATLEASGDAVSPTEELGPDTTGSIRSQESPLQQDREVMPSSSERPKSDDPYIAVPGAGDG